jgi:hypothetical protein
VAVQPALPKTKSVAHGANSARDAHHFDEERNSFSIRTVNGGSSVTISSDTNQIF